MKNAVLVDGVRTPFLKAGSVQGLNATTLGLIPVNELFLRYPALKESIDLVVCANVGNQILPPDGSNLGRIIALHAGIPQHVSAETVNINCASGLQAVRHALRYVASGEAKCVLVVGVEVMSDYTAAYGRRQRNRFGELLATSRSKAPFWKKLPKLALQATGLKLMRHDPQWLIRLGLTDPYCGLGMDKISDAIAADFKISRKEADLFAWESQRRASDAQKSGRLAEEIVPLSAGLPGKDVPITTKNLQMLVANHDSGIRGNQTLEQLAKLRPLNAGGITTPGNSSQVTDGAVALIITDEQTVWHHSWPTLAKMRVDWTGAAGCDPSRMGLGPVQAVQGLAGRTGFKMSEFSLIETNEAFASVVLAQAKALGLPMDVTNVNGGAIAIGHPISASGARLVLTCAKELKRRNQRYGLVTLCVGGGQGVAAIIENPSN